MGLFVLILAFLLDVAVIWQLIHSSIPVSRLTVYLLVVLLIPIVGVSIYYISEFLIPKRKNNEYIPQ